MSDAVVQPLVKPKLRGIPDIVGVVIAVPAVALLGQFAQPGLATAGALVYGASLVTLLGVSASYHTPTWSPAVRDWWRRVDHAAIFVLIAGSYTPCFLLAVGPELRSMVLWMIWGCAGAGVVMSMIWLKPPRSLQVTLYIGMSWSVLPFAAEFLAVIGISGSMLFFGGGVLYITGAITYARRSPNPIPTVYGYHEVFHTLVVLAAACHYALIWRLVT